MPDVELSGSGSISEPSSPGATVTSVYARRDVMYYPINDHELDSIATHNTEQAISASFGAFLLALALSIVVSLFTGDQSRSIGTILGCAAAILVVAALVCFGWAFYIRKASKTEVQRIRDQSRPN